MALTDIAAVTFDVVDRTGTVQRTHAGFAEAIRSDGARVIVDDVDYPAPLSRCLGTLDADGTFGNEHCSNEKGFTEALDYAAAGEQVLWVRGVPYAWWTLATARENGDAWHPIASGTDVLDFATWSPDGDRVAFTTHVPTETGAMSKLSIVRLDTLEVDTLVDEHTYIPSCGFTPDGRGLVYVEGQISGASITWAAPHLMDLGTRSVVTLEIPMTPTFVGPMCVTSD